MIMHETTSQTNEHQPLPSIDIVYVTNGESGFIFSLFLVIFLSFFSSFKNRFSDFFFDEVVCASIIV